MIKEHDRVRVKVQPKRQYSMAQYRNGTVWYYVNAERAGDLKQIEGTWAIKLDDSIVDREHIGIYFAEENELSKIPSENDPQYQKIQDRIRSAVREYGEDLVLAAYNDWLALDPRCRRDNHEWGKEGYDGHGGANERYDCTRPGCNAYVRD